MWKERVRRASWGCLDAGHVERDSSRKARSARGLLDASPEDTRCFQLATIVKPEALQHWL